MRLPPLILFLAASAFSVSGCSKLPAATAADSSPSQPTVTEIAKSFSSYQKLTKEPTFVNPELAMLCRGAGQDEVETARKTKGPHAHTAVKIYMNETAARTFFAGAGTYEPGAVIVKEKIPLGAWDFAAKKSVRPNDGVGGMVKRSPGFDPDHGDWEYFYFEDPAKIETGAIASCVKCHEAAKGKDYVFGTWASHPEFPQRPRP